MYQSGKLDATSLSAEQAKQLKGQSGYTVRQAASTFYFQYNQTKPEFQNKKIRQAISMAIDRKEFVNKVLGNGSIPAKGLVSTGLATRNGKDFADASYVKDGVTVNLAKAKKLWAEGLKEIGKDSLTFGLLSDDTDAAKKTTEFIQSAIESNLKGAKVECANVPFKTRLNRTNEGQFDIVISAWGADFSDPISFLDMFTSNNSYNAGKWKNAQYDKLIEASKSTDAGNAGKRWNDLVSAEKILIQEQGISPLYQQATAWMVKPKVKGVIYNSAGANYNFKNAYVSGN